MRKYKNIIFDFDGTLVSTVGSFSYSVEETFRFFGMFPPPQEEIVRSASSGLSLQDSISVLLPDEIRGEGDRLQEFVSCYREINNREGRFKSHLIDGAREILGFLSKSDYSLILISNKGQHALERDVDHFLLRDYFRGIVGAGGLPYRKPDRRLYDSILSTEFPELKNGQSLMIGDTVADLKFAKSIDIDCCLYAPNGSFESSLPSKPDYLITSLRELSGLF